MSAVVRQISASVHGGWDLRSVLLTAVGEDPVGDFLLHFLKQEGVVTKFIPRKPGRRRVRSFWASSLPISFHWSTIVTIVRTLN